MSGIAGLLHLRGDAIDRGLLGRMTASLGSRGLDKHEIWSDDSIGFGHTLLRTTPESATEVQPLTLDGRVWIVADARIDGRLELIRALTPERDAAELLKVPDVELILRAYLKWGEHCLDRLLGDFAFALWDREHRRLFCARDQLGVKPFFYARADSRFAFSNALSTVRLCPWTSDTIDDLAAADFLLFGIYLDPDTAIWRDTRRLPPAHKLVIEGGRLRLERYWRLEPSASIRYRTKEDYLAHFHQLLNCAVEDRMRAQRVAVLMSGGLDSTSIAAAAKALSDTASTTTDVQAFTAVHRSLFDDEEGRYAERAAAQIGIPIRLLNADDYPLYMEMDRLAAAAPEPFDSPFPALADAMMGLVANDHRVLLDGQGADEILHEDCLTDLLFDWRSSELLRGLWTSLTEYHRRPAICSRSLFGRLRRRRIETAALAAFPIWIRDDLTERLDLRGRWLRVFAPRSDSSRRILRRQAYRRLDSPLWPQYLESADPGTTGWAVESRWPFLDLRLIHDLLAFPPLPWFSDKRILREAMRGQLPPEVLRRKKSPLAVNPATETLRCDLDRLTVSLTLDVAVAQYVEIKGAKELLQHATDGTESDVDLRPLALSYWLRGHS